MQAQALDEAKSQEECANVKVEHNTYAHTPWQARKQTSSKAPERQLWLLFVV